MARQISSRLQAALYFARQNHRVSAVIAALKPAAQGLVVQTGHYVQNKGNAYQAQNGGTMGSTLPVHTGGIVSDGAVKWLYVHPKTLVRVPNPSTPH